MRVATYNVHGLRRFDEVVAAVRAQRLDVLGLQEPPRGPLGPARMRRFAAATGLRLVVRGRGARSTALLVSSSCRVRGPRALRLPWTPGLSRRGAATAVVDGVRVLVVHLGLRAAERERHVALLLPLLAGDGPALVLGDLNENPGSRSRRTLAEHGLTDAAPGLPPTFPAAAPTARIDVVLARGLVATHAAVPDEPTASDHRPVVVHLTPA